MITTPEYKTIDNVKYGCLPFGTKQGLKILVRLVKLFGSVDGLDLSKGYDSILMVIISRALNNVTPEGLIDLINEFLPKCTWHNSDGMAIPLENTFDDHFQLKYSTLGKWLYFVLETNYSDFLGTLMQEVTEEDPKKE
jgi:hypothetical protein